MKNNSVVLTDWGRQFTPAQKKQAKKANATMLWW